MPSKQAFTTSETPSSPPVTGRCYCGKTTVSARKSPLITTYCHCSSCRRLTGAPVAAFSAFTAGDLDISPAPHHAAPVTNGVDRWFCADCGTSLAATYDYLPDQIYVPLGLLDQADALAPTHHSHAGSALPWLHINDDMPRSDGSGRDALNETP